MAKFLHRVKFKNLKIPQRSIRNEVLGKIVPYVNRGASVTAASKKYKISPYQIKKHLGPYVDKKKNRLQFKSNIKIERRRWFYSRGRRISIIIKDSEVGSVISKYLSAVKQSVRARNDRFLSEFRGEEVDDVKGNTYLFETRLEELFRLRHMVEEEYEEQIYDEDSV